MSLDVTKGLPGSQDALVEHHRSDLREGPRAANKVKQVEAERVTELPTALSPCKLFICRALITDRHGRDADKVQRQPEMQMETEMKTGMQRQLCSFDRCSPAPVPGAQETAVNLMKSLLPWG